jgi:hypothetical protein
MLYESKSLNSILILISHRMDGHFQKYDRESAHAKASEQHYVPQDFASSSPKNGAVDHGDYANQK